VAGPQAAAPHKEYLMGGAMWTLLYWLSLAAAEPVPDAIEQERGARAFEQALVDDERRQRQAEADFARGQAQLNQEMLHHAHGEVARRQREAIERHILPSPRWGLELRVAPYQPTLSGDARVHALYDLIFIGQKKSLLHRYPSQLGLEIDGYPFDQLGPLGFFARVAYWRVAGTTRLCVDGTGAPIACTAETVFDSQPGADKAELSVVPLSFGGVWRMDLLRRTTEVPLQFNAKAGLDYHLWWGKSGARSALYQGNKARGGTWGFNLSAGVALGLEAFTRRSVMGHDSRMRNALFVEYQLVHGKALWGKHRSARLDWSDNRMVVVGLSVDFD
jgi:hypothetical protein